MSLGKAIRRRESRLFRKEKGSRRNRDAENRALQKFEQAGFKRRPDYRGRTNWMVAQSRLPAAVRDLVTAGWHVEAEGKLFRNPNSVSMHLSSGIDWFELHGSIEFGDSRITATQAACPR